MVDPVRPRFLNVPNCLTLGRLVLGFLVFGLIAYDRFAAALAVFALAALTDAFDGFFARLLNQATAIGRQLDPLVDKVLNCGVFIYLLTIPGAGLERWMVAVIVVRELLIQWLRSLLEGRGEAFGAKMAGKLKTLFQSLAIAAILLDLAIGSAPTWLLQTRDVLIWLAVALTIYSGIGYVGLAWPRLNKESRPTTP